MKNVNKVLVFMSFLTILAMFMGTVSATSYTVNPGTSIQSVINSASSNDVITVNNKNGTAYTYTENLVVNKKLTLQAGTSGLVTIKASSSSSSTITVNSGGSGTTIKGFTITGATSSAGIYLNGSSSCNVNNNNLNGNYEGIHVYCSQKNSISGNNFTSNSYSGILGEGVDNNTIQNNHFTSNTRGIRLGYYGSSGSSDSNTIQNNIITNSGYGIGIDGSNNNIIINNNITNSGSDGIDIGINTGSIYTTIQNNNITANYLGIHLYCSPHNTISGNNFTSNSYSGILSEGADYNTIQNNNIIDNTRGIRLGYYGSSGGSDSNIIQNNIITGNSYGIGLEGSNSNTIKNNTITNSDSYGLEIGINIGSNSSIIQNNIITNNEYGIYLINSSATINFNQITGNSAYGLYHTGTGTVSAANNWWGSNTPVVSSASGSDIYIAGGTVTYSPWLVLNVTVSPTSTNDSSTITADLTHNSSGSDTSSSGHIPDTLPVNFVTSLGTIINPAYTRNGKANSTFNRGTSTSGTANITVTFDDQNLQTNVTVDANIPIVTVNLPGGVYNTTQVITLNATDDLDQNPAIYYTTNGTDPTTSSTRYTNPITIGTKTTLKFFAVDSDGNQADIETENYYFHIQDAINDASASDTIQVYNGTYTENIVLNQSLTLISDGNVTIHPTNPSNPVITVTSGGAGSTIQGFNINGATGSYGIYLNHADNCTITDDIITNNLYGIYINSSNNSTVTENNIANNLNTGIYLNNSSAKINFNRIVGNNVHGIDNEGNGIVDATNNWWGSNNGPLVSSTNPSDIYNVNGTVHSNLWLLLNIGSSGIVVTHDNYTSDISADLTYNNLGVDTSSSGNILDGILINFITNVGTINATASTISGTALSTLNSSITAGLANVTVTLDNQTVSMIQEVFNSIQTAIDDSSTLNGDIIDVEDGTYTENIVLNKQLTLMPINTGNVILQPASSAAPVITVTSSGAGSVIQNFNIIGAINSYGIYLNFADNCSITGNNLTNNNFGIYSNNSLNSTISSNNVTNNYNGIYLYNSPNNTISGNSITNNTGNGIYLDTSNRVEISTNTILNNLYNGICIYNSLNSTIYQNNILNNTLDGIYLNNSSASINFNRIFGNARYGLENEGNGTVDATDNWWGTNNPVVSSNLGSDIYNNGGTVTYNPWLVLTVTSSCDRSNSTGSTYNYIITADLTHDNQGNDTSSDGSIPDDIPIFFNTTLGTVDTSASTRNGKAVATLTNAPLGTANVSATLDNQTITIPVTVMSTNGLGIYNNRTGEGFTTIQSAIDDDNTQNGDTITLTDGTYTENVIVDKRVTIRPVSGANVTVQPADSSSPVFTITSDGNGSTIQGLNINSSSYGIYLDSASNCNITGNNITNTQYGIYVDGSNSAVISGNNVTNNYYGAYIHNAISSNITGNSLKSNFVEIYVDTSNNNTISGNNITIGWDGIYLGNSNNNNITLNNITNIGVGINYLNSNSTTITGNNITNSSIQDILQIDPTGIVMSSNIFNCGPAALATIMQNLGIDVTQDELANYAGTDETGTSMYGLVQATLEEGLIAKGLKLTANELELGNIVYLTMNGQGHFSIFEGINGTTVSLADPDLGNINMTLDNFTAAFIQDTANGYGYALVVTNDSNDPQLSNNNTLTDDEMQDIIGTSSWKYVWKYTWRYYWKWKWVKIPTRNYHVNKYYANKVTVHINGQWWKGTYIGEYTVIYYHNTMTINSHWDKMLVKQWYKHWYKLGYKISKSSGSGYTVVYAYTINGKLIKVKQGLNGPYGALFSNPGYLNYHYPSNEWGKTKYDTKEASHVAVEIGTEIVVHWGPDVAEDLYNMAEFLVTHPPIP